MWTVGIAVEREKVVPVEGDIDTEVFATPHGVADISVMRGVLRLQPRFNIDAAMLDTFVDAIDDEMGYLCSLS